MKFTTSRSLVTPRPPVDTVNVCCTELDSVTRLGFVEVEPWMHESGSREFIRAKTLRK